MSVRILMLGDLGDVISSLPILRALGGGEIVVSESRFTDRGRAPRETMRGARYEAIRPLLEAQPYVSKVEWQDEPMGITHDLSFFRTVPPLRGENLAERQARYLGVETNLEPWLTVPKFEQHGRTILARSSRYHNFFFPWGELIHKCAPVTFVGLPAEHLALERETKWNFPYQPTKDLLELAMVISGAKLVIANQSAPFWIAVGLGMPLIQETFAADPNSIVRRDNCVYTLTGGETRTLVKRLFPKPKRKVA